MEKDRIKLWEDICGHFGLKKGSSLRVILQELYGKQYLNQLSEEEFRDFRKRMHERMFRRRERKDSMFLPPKNESLSLESRL